MTLAGGHAGRAIRHSMTTVTLGAATSLVGIWLSRRFLRPSLVNDSHQR